MVNFFVIFILLVASAGPGFSASLNVTVDDKFGPSPPEGSAIQFGEGWFDNDFETCGRACEGIATFKAAFNGTWKRSIYNRIDALDMPKTANFSFKGTAVYVNAILTGATAAGVRGNSDITFLLDNQATYFLRNAPISRGQTAQTVFSVTNLADQNHTLTIINGRLNSSFEQMILLLDSIVYTMSSTQDSDTPSQVTHNDQGNRSPSRSSVPIIAGVFAGVGVVILGLLASWLYLRARAHKLQSLSSSPNESRASPAQRIVPFLAYKSPLPPGRRSEPFNARGGGLESQPLPSPPASPHRPETVFSMIPPSYRSRSAMDAPLA